MQPSYYSLFHPLFLVSPIFLRLMLLINFKAHLLGYVWFERRWEKGFGEKGWKRRKIFFFLVGEKLRDKKENCREYISIGPTIFFPRQIGKKWESREDFLWGSPNISFSFFFLIKQYFPSILLYKPNTMKENYSPFPFFSSLIFSSLPLFFAKHSANSFLF